MKAYVVRILKSGVGIVIKNAVSGDPFGILRLGGCEFVRVYFNHCV